MAGASTSGSKDEFGMSMDDADVDVEIDVETDVDNESNPSMGGSNTDVDVSDGGDSEEIDEEIQAEIDELMEMQETDPDTIIQDVIKEDIEFCTCYHFDDKVSPLTLLDSISKCELTYGNIDCILDNIVRCCLHIFRCGETSNTVYRVALVDLFYRARHEICFKLLCLSYGLPAQKSDIPFSDFGIDSMRTPDLIIEINGVLVILEVTAVGSAERGAISKGVEQMGFESKYKREMDLINESGRSCKYIPIIFNMNDPSHPYDTSQLMELDSFFIKSKTNYNFMVSNIKKIAIFSTEIKTFLLLPSVQLFSKAVPIKKDHSLHSFIYKVERDSNVEWGYKDLVISPEVYRKVLQEWSRFERIVVNKDILDHQKVKPIINLQNSKVDVERDPQGVTAKEFIDIIINNDKIRFFKLLKLKTAGGYHDPTNSEKGVKITFREKLPSKSKYNNTLHDEILGDITTFQSHKTRLYKNENFSLEPYERYIDNDESMHLNFKDFDNGYEDKMLDKLMKFDLNDNPTYNKMKDLKLLGSLSALDIDIDRDMESIKRNFILMNTPRDEIPLIKLKMKQPFILPMAKIDSKDYCGLNYKNSELIDSIILSLPSGNQYTQKILENARSDRYTFHRRSKAPSQTLIELKNRRVKLSNNINVLQKEIYRKGSEDGEVKISRTTDPKYRTPFVRLKKEVNDINKVIKDRSAVEGVTNNTDFIRLPSKGNSLMSSEYKSEMSHFRDKRSQATTEGVGIRNSLESDFESDKEIFHNINESLTTYCGINPDPLLDNYVADDTRLLSDLKKAALKEYEVMTNSVKNSRLGHSAALVSRLAHSLMFYSQMSFNSDYIRVDNLGYKNVMLIVKGGKKIFKSKCSKMFRLICPLLPETMPWYISGHTNKGSSIFFKHMGEPYILTPWTLLHESILTDSISFYPRICSFVILNLNPKVDMTIQYNKVSLNVMLAFHNRRQTEVLLANMRYILLSTLGDFTGVSEILKEFFSFNYDCCQSFIRASILFNYPIYFKQLMTLKASKPYTKDINTSDFKSINLKNIFTGAIINKVEDLTLMIYSTFLMTKAPYQKSVERANNLRGILKINELYRDTIGLNLTPSQQYSKINVELKEGMDYCQYAEELFKNDFNFDAKYCSVVGTFIDSELMNKGLKDEIYGKWYSILSSSWDELATSTGLRGDYNDVENFWGQKGYFIVYKSLLSDRDFNEMLQDLLYSNKTDNEKRSLLRRLNVAFLDKVNDDREFLIFHAVDKVQWKGGREIYVMDLFTKTLQQPIEKFMGFLCKQIDNELISIPSDKRSQVIHHSIFEKDLPLKETLSWYLTLDCTKWAPKSIFMKFITTILPMQSLPNSFKIHFMNYSEKLFFKRIYFNTKEVEVLSKNPRYKEVCAEFLIKDETINGYYMLMPYSWVMGIFNYTSSFLHAANQKYSAHLINVNSLNKYGEETILFMFAHSDDSGGRLSTSSWELAQRALIIYEINLKGCNHLLSKKKSVVSRIYFEILSIIYLFKKLMALLPKFLGGLRFLPTDKGPCQDLSQSYSKCIEVLIAGANFSVAYLILKITSMMIWRFYFNQPPTELDYKRPVQYMGMPDAHPLMILLCGSEADIIRIFKRDRLHLERVFKFSNKIMLSIDEPTPIKPYKFTIKVKNIKRGFEDHLESYKKPLDSWSIRNVNYHNSALNCLNFLNKLRDSGFVGSLVNESTTRRFSRSYFMRSQDCLMTAFGNLKIQDVLESLRLFQGFSSEIGAVRMVLENILTEEEIKNVINDIEDNNDELNRTMRVIEETCYSPIKMYKYLDQLTLEGRTTAPHIRTLKPTVVQLVKSTNIFSSKFDPPSLVSYLKEPEMRWAIPEIRGLFTAEQELQNFLYKKGFDVETMDPDSLLKICRDFGPNGMKTIYLYSRVPHELRQIKSYSAFLTYLSLNTFDNLEIQGLTLKLTNSEMATGYTMSNVNEEVYEINNILSLISILFNKLDIDFFNSLLLSNVGLIDWKGGSIHDFVVHLQNYFQFDVHYCYFIPQIVYVKCITSGGSRSADQLNRGAFYTFLKAQKLRKGWYGKGEIYIMIENVFYSFELYNNLILSVKTNHSGKVILHHYNYIKDICDNIGIEIMKMAKVNSDKKVFTNTYFGFDYSGHLSVTSGREIGSGVPCSVCSYRGGFVDELYNYVITDYVGDVITLRCDLYNEPIFKKIYTLPLKRVEILQTIRSLLDKEQFKVKLDTMGLESFEDFIYTELLTEYGAETYVEFNDLFDNYAGSKLFKILNEVSNSNISLIPKNPVFSNFPANDGSLTKILVDYSNSTGEIIIDTRKELNSAVMRIRSEYPEQMGVILSEKLVEYYTMMYTKEERREISDEYHRISYSDDLEVVRNSIIKLMTYWGYGGLVNSIQNFSLVRVSQNYNYFNSNIIQQGRQHQYSKLFETFINEVFQEMMDWSGQYFSLDFYSLKLRNRLGMSSVITNYIRYLCLSCYKFSNIEIAHDILVLQFNNTLLALLKDEDFCSSLQLRLSGNYLLGCLPISYRYREEFIVLLNVLRWAWCKVNTIDYSPDFTAKMERLADNIPSWKSISKCFKHPTPPIFSYYNGGLSVNTAAIILSRGNSEIKTADCTYRISVKMVKPSIVAIPVSKAIKFKRPIKSSLLDDDNWEDLMIELDTDDPYQESIDELLEEMGDLYTKKVTRVISKGTPYKKVLATIKWVIHPARSCCRSVLRNLRQVGENVILLTTSIFLNLGDYFKNVKVRVLEFDKGETLLCYAILQDELNNDKFIDRFLGTTQNYIQSSDLINLFSSKVRNNKGEVVDSVDAGHFIGGDIMSGKTVFTEEEGITSVKDSSSMGTDSKDEAEKPKTDYDIIKANKQKVYDKIEGLKTLGLSTEVCNRLRSKFLNIINNHKMSMEIILQSISKESNLNLLNMDLASGALSLTSSQYKESFLAPKCNSLAHGISTFNNKSIKSKEVVAELNALHDEMAGMVGSGVVLLSSSFKKVIDANYKMWKNMVKYTNYKKENKSFLMVMFTTILSCCKIVEEDDNDHVWQSMVNKTSLYITDDPDSSDDDFDDLMFSLRSIIPGSRIKYKVKGSS